MSKRRIAPVLAVIIAGLFSFSYVPSAHAVTACTQCQDNGSGDCACNSFTGNTDPNTRITPHGGFYNMQECKTGSTPPVTDPPTDGKCWFADFDCSTSTTDLAWTCPDNSFHFNTFVRGILDANGDPLTVTPAQYVEFNENFTSTEPVDNHVRMSMATSYEPNMDPTKLNAAGLCTMGNTDPDCLFDNTLNVRRALGAHIQVNGVEASLKYPLFMTEGFTPSVGTKAYSWWGIQGYLGTSTTRADMAKPIQAACTIQSATVALADATTRQALNLTGASAVLRVGVAIAGVDYELCTIGTGTSSNTCTGLSRAMAEQDAVAMYVSCDNCTDASVRLVYLQVGCL